MSQVSPDGRRVVTTIKPPGTPGTHFYYVANFADYRFLQVFYPTRGILVWYDRDARKLQPLPGADDPRYVQTNAVWSPDGKYLVFARAEAKDPYPAGGKLAAYANDPAEVPIQYDLYRIPFNDGKGGKPEAIAGASRNGMSNSFPKISPDGRWIVFVQARNGLVDASRQPALHRPGGGRAGAPHELQYASDELLAQFLSQRPVAGVLLQEPLAVHPDVPHPYRRGRARYPCHPDRELDGQQSRREHPGVRQHRPQAASSASRFPPADFYRQFDIAAALTKNGDYASAITEWTKALALTKDDARAYNDFGVSLAGVGRTKEAIAQYQQALALRPHYAEAHDNLGNALVGTGRLDEAIGHYRQALEDDPSSGPGA